MLAHQSKCNSISSVISTKIGSKSQYSGSSIEEESNEKGLTAIERTTWLHAASALVIGKAGNDLHGR